MTLVLLFTLYMFTRLDGHAVWINRDQVLSIQGAEQLGYHRGTIINLGGVSVIVQQNVSEVVRKLRGEDPGERK